MERRAFLQSLAAAVGTSALPAGLLGQTPLASGLYARAVRFAAGGTYFSAKFLSASLGVSPSAGAEIISRLKANGVVTEMGKTGLMAFKSIHAEHALMTAQAIQKASAIPRKATAKDDLATIQDLQDKVDFGRHVPDDLRDPIRCDCDDASVIS